MLDIPVLRSSSDQAQACDVSAVLAAAKASAAAILPYPSDVLRFGLLYSGAQQAQS